jgi:hypothetical protein
MEFKIVFKSCGNDSRGLSFHDLKACKISRCTARICLTASYEVHLLKNASRPQRLGPSGPQLCWSLVPCSFRFELVPPNIAIATISRTSVAAKLRGQG